MLDAVRGSLCDQRFPAPSLDMFAIQEERSGVEASMLLATTAANASTSCINRPLLAEKSRTRPHPSQVLKCPRCDSVNTKFCYYNNYNVSQPRHFCKACRRYWTNGGILRNVPVGGGCRKSNHNKKSKPRNNTTAATPHHQHRNQIPKSATNSTVTFSSSESSPITVNNDTTSTSNSSLNVSDTDRIGRGIELQDILKHTETGNLADGNIPPEGPVPRLFSGLDYFSQPYSPSFPAARSWSENVNANSSFSSLLGGSNFVGTTFSDLQCKLQQQKTAAAFNGDATLPTRLNTDKVPEPSAEPLCTYATNNSFLSHDNCNNIIPLDWQGNNNSQMLFEEPYCWGAESLVNWVDQTQFSYPNLYF